MQITISEEMRTRIAEYKQVIEVVIEEETDFDTCVEMVLSRGIEAMTTDLLGNLEHPTLLRMWQQLSSQYPAQVYQYMAETLKRGAIAGDREELKQRIGFSPPTGAGGEVREQD